jgi:hypothetical protein
MSEQNNRNDINVNNTRDDSSQSTNRFNQTDKNQVNDYVSGEFAPSSANHRFTDTKKETLKDIK